MKHQQGFTLIALLCLVITVFCIAIVIDNASCKAKWSRSGMADVSWGPIQGCLVKLPDGRWLPEERIREIEIPKTIKPKEYK